MKKSTIQLIISAIALLAAIAIAAVAVADEQQCNAEICQTKLWKEFLTDNQDAQFTADWKAAQEKCKGETICMEAELKAKGWK